MHLVCGSILTASLHCLRGEGGCRAGGCTVSPTRAGWRDGGLSLFARVAPRLLDRVGKGCQLIQRLGRGTEGGRVMSRRRRLEAGYPAFRRLMSLKRG